MYTCKRMHAGVKESLKVAVKHISITSCQLLLTHCHTSACRLKRASLRCTPSGTSAQGFMSGYSVPCMAACSCSCSATRLHNSLKIMSKQVLRGSTNLCNYPLELPAGPGLHSCTQCRPLPPRASRCCCGGCCCCSPGDADGGPGRSGVARSPRGRRVGERCRSERRTPEGEPVSWPAPQGAERNLL